MKAAVYHRFGSPDVLELLDIPQPALADDGVLVRVRASSVNPAEWFAVTAGRTSPGRRWGCADPSRRCLGPTSSGPLRLVLRELLEAGKVTSVIDRQHELTEVPAALTYLGEGHARAKVVITV